MRRRLIIIFLIVIAMSGSLWWAWSRSDSETGPFTQIESNNSIEVTVKRGDLLAFVEATGQIEAHRYANLALPISGIVTDLYVEVNDKVTVDMPLLKVNPNELLLRQEEAQIAVNTAEARFARETSGASTGEIEAAQAKLIAAQLALSVAEAKLDQLPVETQAENTEAVAVEQARAQLAQAEAVFNRLIDGPSAEEQTYLLSQVEQSRIRLTQAKAALAHTTLQAPFTGTITTRQIRIGERANPSQVLFSLADLETLFIAAEVDEVDISHITIGQAVTITLDAFATQPFLGSVTRIAPAASSQRGATTYRTIIDFAPIKLPIRLDMAADLRIRTANVKQALLLPLNVIRYAETQPYVLVKRENEWVEQDVLLGSRDEKDVEILQGVIEGEVVERP